jgi:hypothetical protein
MTSYVECLTKSIRAANGIDYAYRELGGGPVPLVVLHHFRGNLDYWDPPLIDEQRVGVPPIARGEADLQALDGAEPRGLPLAAPREPQRLVRNVAPC